MKKRLLILLLITFISGFFLINKKVFASEYSPYLGFVFSGAVNPPQFYPSTFEKLRTKWSVSYHSSLVDYGLTAVPLVSQGNPDGYNHIATLGFNGTGDEIIDITPWAKPTWFRVSSRDQIQRLVDQHGYGSFWEIGSEPNVLTTAYTFAFSFEQNPYWNFSDFWNWAIHNGGNFNFDNADQSQGEYSLFVENSTPNQNWVRSGQIKNTETPSTQISGNKKYRVWISIKTQDVVASEGQGAGLHIYENGQWPGSLNGGGRTTMLTGSHDWQEYTFDFTTQPETTYLEVFVGLGFGGSAAGKVWFDNFRISEVDGSGNAVSEKQIINTFTGDSYAPLYHYYVNELKEIDLTAKIIGPNFLTFSNLPDNAPGAYGAYIPGKVWFDQFLSRYRNLYSNDPYFDIYATHVYDNLRPWNLEEYLAYAKQNVSEFRDYINQNFGADKTVWLTEFGVQTPGVPETEVAKFLEAMHHYLKARGDIDKWFWAWSLAPTYYPFSGYLFKDNSPTSELTTVGTLFSQLALKDFADLNNDGQVNFQDLILLLQNWGSSPANPQADLNSDGIVNGIDFEKLRKLII